MNYNDVMVDTVNIFAVRTFNKVIVKVRQFCQTLCVLIEEQQSRKQSSKSVLCGGLMSPSNHFLNMEMDIFSHFSIYIF